MGRSDTGKMLGAVAKMRNRIAQARGAAQFWALKSGAGRLQDIEMIAQLGHLAAGGGNRQVSAGLDACVETGLLNDAGRQDLRRAYRLLFSLWVALKLLSRDAIERDQIGIGAQKVLLRLTGKETMDELAAAIETVTTAAAATIDKLLPKPEEDADER
jgi:glutamate-ammonia-ligase adenylyltransferase